MTCWIWRIRCGEYSNNKLITGTFRTARVAFDRRAGLTHRVGEPTKRESIGPNHWCKLVPLQNFNSSVARPSIVCCCDNVWHRLESRESDARRP